MDIACSMTDEDIKLQLNEIMKENISDWSIKEINIKVGELPPRPPIKYAEVYLRKFCPDHKENFTALSIVPESIIAHCKENNENEDVISFMLNDAEELYKEALDRRK